MEKKSTTLTTDIQLEWCINNEINIEVWIKSCCDYSGKVVGVTEEIIQVKDGYFLREFCVIKTKERMLRRVV